MNFNQIKFGKPSIYVDGIGGGIVPPVVYDVNAQYYFDRVTAASGTLTTPEKNAINTLVLSLKASDAWTKTLALYPFLGTTAATNALNLKTNNYDGTFYGGWLFQSTGVKPNGTNAYFNTTIRGYPELVNEKYISMSTYVNEFIETPRAQMGAIGANNTINMIAPKVDSATLGRYVATGNNTSTMVTDATAIKGFLGVSRISLTDFRYYKGNVETLSTLAAGLGGYIYPIVMGAFGGYAGVIGNFDNARIAFGHLGNGLTSAEMLSLQSAVNTYTLALGRN